MNDPAGNFISEWFGHRIFPTVVSTAQSLADQRSARCPFLSAAKGEDQECIKTEAARGVCSISCASNGPRQDWVVCPYRAFDPALLELIVRRMYGFKESQTVRTYPAPVLGERDRQREALDLLARGQPVLVYFDQKMGGEIQVGPTPSSPQIAFDTTFVELRQNGDAITFGRFAIVEIQTMDFHGSYRNAVRNLQDALRLHGDGFPASLQENPQWNSRGIEGPNIANVFKRTFYQLMLKFEIAATDGCAGVALAIPEAVWDSWQRFLGAPELGSARRGFGNSGTVACARD